MVMAHSANFDLKNQSEIYKARYELKDPNSKLVDNFG